jgi:hypothetical protein
MLEVPFLTASDASHRWTSLRRSVRVWMGQVWIISPYPAGWIPDAQTGRSVIRCIAAVTTG